MFLAGMQEEENASPRVLLDRVAMTAPVFCPILSGSAGHELVTELSLANHHRLLGRSVVLGWGRFLVSTSGRNKAHQGPTQGGRHRDSSS
jgi:hypothetical protein